MGGIMTLYFAILQTPLGSLAQTLPSGAPTPEQLSTLVIEPFRLPETWTWLASALRPPLPGLPPMAQLLTTCLDIAGPSLLKWAGHVQISKLLIAIKTALDAGKITGDSAAARARLELLLDEWAKTKMIKAPKGRDWDP
jgi:hypothetical protein